MKVTILGASPAVPNPGGACTGLLVQSATTAVLVDCGPGVVSQLGRHLDFHHLTAIIMSHFHADHCMDLVMLRNGLKYAPWPGPKPRPYLYLPPHGGEFLTKFGHLFGMGEPHNDFFGDQFHIQEYNPLAPVQIGPLTVSFAPTKHYIDCWAMRFDDGVSVAAFSSDTGPGADLMRIAHQADVFICEAGVESRAAEPLTWGHLAPDEAGHLAREAGVKRLVLTHIWHEYDRRAMRNVAARVYGGPTDLAEESQVYVI